MKKNLQILEKSIPIKYLIYTIIALAVNSSAFYFALKYNGMTIQIDNFHVNMQEIKNLGEGFNKAETEKENISNYQSTKLNEKATLVNKLRTPLIQSDSNSNNDLKSKETSTKNYSTLTQPNNINMGKKVDTLDKELNKESELKTRRIQENTKKENHKTENLGVENKELIFAMGENKEGDSTTSKIENISEPDIKNESSQKPDYAIWIALSSLPIAITLLSCKKYSLMKNSKKDGFGNNYDQVSYYDNNHNNHNNHV